MASAGLLLGRPSCELKALALSEVPTGSPLHCDPLSEGVLHEAHWPREYPNCGGKRQSPIDLHRKKVWYNPSLRALNLSGYEVQHGAFPMINNGHTGKGGRQAPVPRRVWGEAGRQGCQELYEQRSRAWPGGCRPQARGRPVLSPGTSSLLGQHPSVDSVPHWPLHPALASL